MSHQLHAAPGGGFVSFELCDKSSQILYFGHKPLLPNSFSTAVVKSNSEQSQQDLEHCYSNFFFFFKLILWHFHSFVANFNP